MQVRWTRAETERSGSGAKPLIPPLQTASLIYGTAYFTLARRSVRVPPDARAKALLLGLLLVPWVVDSDDDDDGFAVATVLWREDFESGTTHSTDSV